MSRPAASARKARKLPVERWTMANGLTVLYRQDPDFPLSSATLLFRVGSRHEKSSEEGLCSMTVDLLMQGTRRRTARELARVMEAVGASIGTQVHEDYSELGFVVPSTEIDRALGVMVEVLTEPSFPNEEIVKEKAHTLANLSSRRDAIFNVAYDALNAKMYGSHPYGRPVEGIQETVKTFKRADFQKWHAKQLRPDAAILSLIGPQPLREVRRLLDRHLSCWKTVDGQPDNEGPSVIGYPALSEKSGKDQPETIRSNFEQAYLMVGVPAPQATHADQIPLKVINTILGGGMSSRLFETLREKWGLAYEVSSFYPTRMDSSLWVIYLGLPQEKLKLAAEKLDDLLGEFVDQGPTAVEVRQAKAMIRGAFLMDRQSRRRQAWSSAWWEFLGRDLGYNEQYLQAIDAVTPKQLHALARNMLAQPRVTVRVIPK